MSREANALFTDEVVEGILRVLKRGGSVELKRENDKLVIVEIHRKVNTKLSITG